MRPCGFGRTAIKGRDPDPSPVFLQVILMHTRAPAAGFLAGSSRVAQQIIEKDWSNTPLGPIETWPQSLRTALSMILNSRFPIYMTWGPELISFYNDAYTPILGIKQDALGKPFRELWAEAWDTVGPIAAKAMAGESSFFENLPITLERYGAPEQTWWTFSYSPIRDESGGVGGVLCTVLETTAEVEARASLQSEKNRLQALFEQAPGLMALLSGPEHVFEFANAAYLNRIGQHDVIGRNVLDVLPELEGQGIIELLDEVYATGKPYVGSQRRLMLRRRPDQPLEVCYIDFVYQPIRDNSGRVTGVFVEGHDVTRQAQTEMALRESEERFRNLADHAPVMVWVTEPDGACSYLSRSWYEFTGQTEETGLGFGWLDAVHPDDRGWSGQVFRDANAEREAFRLEYRLRRADGTYGWAIDAAAPRFGDDGTFLGYVGSVIDITERKQIEELLRASEAEFRTVANAAPALVWVCSNDGDNLYMNEQWHGYTGQSVTDAHGSGWIGAMHPEDVARILPYWQRCRETGDIYEGEVRYRRHDGEYRWHAFRALPHSDDGSTRKWFGVSVDIHERRSLEEQQQLLINELNHRVKNTLATVQSMAAQSFRGTDAADLPKISAFQDRLFALARAHDVLTRENWEAAELRDLITEVLEPYLKQNAMRFEIEGPRLRLIPRTALAIAMTVHELATNAAKYGALSTPAGCVILTWTVTSDDERRLMLRWQEQDGPTVAKPTRRGFGTRLIERGLTQEMGGHAQLTYEPAGVVCVMDVPLEDG